GFDFTRPLNSSHILCFPSKPIQDRSDGRFRTIVIAANEHRRLTTLELRIHHRCIAYGVKAFTKCASGNSRCNRSMSDSSRVVKNFKTPFCGGASAIGLVVSMTGLPARLDIP